MNCNNDRIQYIDFIKGAVKSLFASFICLVWQFSL